MTSERVKTYYPFFFYFPFSNVLFFLLLNLVLANNIGGHELSLTTVTQAGDLHAVMINFFDSSAILSSVYICIIRTLFH